MVQSAVFILEHKQTDRQTDVTERPTHASSYAEMRKYNKYLTRAKNAGEYAA